MLTVRLPKEIESRLEDICKKTGRSKSYYVRVAISYFLEDKEDLLLAIARPVLTAGQSI